jgi:hypothetical protein
MCFRQSLRIKCEVCHCLKLKERASLLHRDRKLGRIVSYNYVESITYIFLNLSFSKQSVEGTA